MNPESLCLAIRAYPELANSRKGKRRRLAHWRRPRTMLVFDTETRTDATQTLLFGSYRFFKDGLCLEEGLFYADDLPRGLRARQSCDRWRYLNEGKTYNAQVKPFNFIVTAHVKALGHPIGADPERFHLIAPYETDARRWTQMQWTDQYSGKRYRVSTTGQHGARGVARVKTYGDVLREYEFHPEAKCADASGTPCGKQSVGLLLRRHVRADGLRYIGKESNRLEGAEAGAVHDTASVYAEYPDPRRDEWTTKILPALQAMPLPELQRLSGLSRAALQAIRAGRRPHATNRRRFEQMVAERP